MEAGFVVIDEDGGGGVRCLFVTAVLLPPCHNSRLGGKARKPFQMSCGQSVITSKRDGFNFIYFKTTLRCKWACT
jgi:hypothetical protein